MAKPYLAMWFDLNLWELVGLLEARIDADKNQN